MSDTDRHAVTYEQAAQLLGVSVRTVQRRVRGGQLATVSDNGRQLVVLPLSTNLVDKPEVSFQNDNVPSVEGSSREHARQRVNDSSSSGERSSRMQELENRVRELEADRDKWRTVADKLSATVASQQQMIQAQFLERATNEGRVLAHRAAETPVERHASVQPTQTPPRRIRGLRDLYRAWRGR